MKHKWKQAVLIGCAVLGIATTQTFSGQAIAAEANASPDLNTLLKDSVALSIGSPNSLSFGEAKFIDKENSEITPYIKNQRTLTPLRFISASTRNRIAMIPATTDTGTPTNSHTKYPMSSRPSTYHEIWNNFGSLIASDGAFS